VSAASEREQRFDRVDFDRAPFTVAWEVTRSCAYRCMHCRADAQPRRDPRELNTGEGVRLLTQLASFDPSPILVLTGGDPLMRRDIFELAGHADRLGLRVSLTPTATALTTRERMRAARAAGVRRVAFSLDAADGRTHDRFRGFEGSYDRTLRGMENAAAEGLALQVNTTACRLNAGRLEEMVPLLRRWEVVQWSVFFLVPVGRGAVLPMLSAAEHERLLGWLADLADGAPFDVKTTAAPQYRRIVARRSRIRATGEGAGAGARRGAGPGFRFADGLDRPARGVNDGKGFMFISHRGEVMPSGFLPLAAGDVRRRSPVDVYRDSTIFRRLRDPAALKGKCGRCEYRQVCGGSRARAYAVTGDYLGEDPSCSYQPQPRRDA
jgi:AdoMet-dependent heme synthase